MQFQKIVMLREDPGYDGYDGDDGKHVFVVIFGSPLFCTESESAVQTFASSSLKDDFFLKTVPDIGHS